MVGEVQSSPAALSRAKSLGFQTHFKPFHRSGSLASLLSIPYISSRPTDPGCQSAIVRPPETLKTWPVT